ncbi:MAG: purine-nucleoside phosphorylase [Oscillospiraceae bacterium]
MEAYKRLTDCLDFVKSKTAFVPETALVLGSGLGGFAEEIEAEAVINYRDIPGFPASTVPGHAGRFVLGRLNGLSVIAMQGRVHYYEGYSMEEVVLPIRLMGMLGAKVLLLTNAAGGMGTGFVPGTLMRIVDQLSLFVPSPLIGPNLEALGTRFPDMSAIYDKQLGERINEAARELEIPLREGVYAQLTGSQYESPAEIRALRALGADAVGMSTACEAIAANHMGLRVAGISCITNLASGMNTVPLSHAEVQETADRVAAEFKKLVALSIAKFGEICEERV